MEGQRRRRPHSMMGNPILIDNGGFLRAQRVGGRVGQAKTWACCSEQGFLWAMTMMVNLSNDIDDDESN